MRPGGGRQTAAAALDLEVADNLPLWSPTPPRGGWSPAAVWSAASEYADAHAPAANWRHVTQHAARALFRELPDVKRAEIVDRLQGRDWRADVLGLTTTPDVDDLDDVAPF